MNHHKYCVVENSSQTRRQVVSCRKFMSYLSNEKFSLENPISRVLYSVEMRRDFSLYSVQELPNISAFN